MRGLGRLLRWIAPLAVPLASIAAAPAAAYDVQEIGSFHIGGAPVKLEGLPMRKIPAGGTALDIDPNGEFHTGQMYVQFVLLKEPKAKYPLLLWHTGGVTGTAWETKPDGNPGWMQYFLQRGHNVYVSDAVERGRATFSRYPEIYRSEPIFRAKKEAWELFRIGVPGSWSSDPSKRMMNTGQLFPVSAFDTLQMQMAPRWASNDAATQAAYDALVERACPCTIIAHGQAGQFAMRTAQTNPQKVKAIVALEPAHAPRPDADIARLADIPHLYVWGDYIQTNPVWVAHVKEVRTYYDALRTRDVPADWLDLPETGIRGNTHMIMMDANSDLIAGHVQAWLARHKLAGSEAKGVSAKSGRDPKDSGRDSRGRRKGDRAAAAE